MRIYWYWPFVHPEDLVVPAAVPRPDDELVLHTMRGQIADEGARDLPIELRQTLATVGDERERSAAWAVARARAYVSRARERRRAIESGAFDVCHVVYPNYFTDGLTLPAIARRTSLVYEVHDVVPHQSRVPRALERKLLARLYPVPGTIVVRHAHVRDRLVTEFAVDPTRIEVVEYHVPETGARPRAAPRDRPCVLFFGTLRRNKGVGVLLEAIALLGDRADLTFAFVGRGFADVEEQVRRAAARDARIVFEQGYVTEARKRHWYEACDLVVLPYTEFASTSGVLADAYSYRVPVVVTDVGALGESVRADGTGRVVKPRDAVLLAAAIDTALADAPSWGRASARAAEVATSRAPAAIAARMRALYGRRA